MCSCHRLVKTLILYFLRERWHVCHFENTIICLDIYFENIYIFGCQLDQPYGFPGDHQPKAEMPWCTYWYLPWSFVIVLLLCSVGNKTYYYYYINIHFSGQNSDDKIVINRLHFVRAYQACVWYISYDARKDIYIYIFMGVWTCFVISYQADPSYKHFKCLYENPSPVK